MKTESGFTFGFTKGTLSDFVYKASVFPPIQRFLLYLLQISSAVSLVNTRSWSTLLSAWMAHSSSRCFSWNTSPSLILTLRKSHNKIGKTQEATLPGETLASAHSWAVRQLASSLRCCPPRLTNYRLPLSYREDSQNKSFCNCPLLNLRKTQHVAVSRINGSKLKWLTCWKSGSLFKKMLGNWQLHPQTGSRYVVVVMVVMLFYAACRVQFSKDLRLSYVALYTLLLAIT